MPLFLLMNRRTFVTATTASAAGLVVPRSWALMAGGAPDSPLLRLDANRRDSPYACVASLMGAPGVYSAVCIAPRFALTAAHVVGGRAEALQLYLNLDRDLSHRFAIKKVMFPPAPVPRDVGRLAGDLALVEIEGAFPAGLVFAPLARTVAHESLRIELAGYGASGHGDRGASVASNAALKRVGANRVDQLWLSEDAARQALLYFFTFNAPSQGIRVPSASLGNAVETGLASGDSGSPAFVREEGRLALWGINTFVVRSGASTLGLNAFGTRGGGQVLAAYKPWLLSMMGEGAWEGLV
jgi:hypothetical protein